MGLALTDSKIAVIPIEDPDRSEGGIWYPDESKQRCDNGVIKYRGPAASLPIGSHVLFGGYVGTRIALEDEGTLIIMDESDVEAIWTEEDPTPLFDLPTIERIITARMGEIQSSGETLPIEEVCDDLISRFRSLTISEGFMF